MSKSEFALTVDSVFKDLMRTIGLSPAEMFKKRVAYHQGLKDGLVVNFELKDNELDIYFWYRGFFRIKSFDINEYCSLRNIKFAIDLKIDNENTLSKVLNEVLEKASVVFIDIATLKKKDIFKLK